MQKIGKFGMNNPDIAVNVLLNSENGIHTARRSELNKKEASKLTYYRWQIKNRQCTAINNISRLLSKLNGKSSLAYHFCMNCLNGFWKVSPRGTGISNSTMSGAAAMVMLKLKCLLRKKIVEILQ